MEGITKAQYQKEQTRRLAERRNKQVAQVKALRGRAERLDAAYRDRAVLTFEQHQQLEDVQHTLNTPGTFYGLAKPDAELTESGLNLYGSLLVHARQRLEKLEVELEKQFDRKDV